MSFSGNPQFALPQEVEQDKLWVPQTAAAIDDKNRYDAVFKTTSRRNIIYVTTKPWGGNVLPSSVLAEVRRFDMMVNNQLNATGHTAARKTLALVDALGNPAVHYDDVCAQSSSSFGGNDTEAPNCQVL